MPKARVQPRSHRRNESNKCRCDEWRETGPPGAVLWPRRGWNKLLTLFQSALIVSGREPGRSAMTRDQTTNFRNSAAPFFLGRIVLTWPNLSFSRLRIEPLGRVPPGRSQFKGRRVSASATRKLFAVSSP